MSREALVRETLRLPWSDVLCCAPSPTKVIVAKDPSEVVGVVVALRGRWWGMTIVRCDRAIATEIATRRAGRDRAASPTVADFDAAVRWIGLEIAKAVRRTVDLTAELGDAIVLSGDETHWVPKHGTLHAEASFKVVDRTFVVSAYERTRSDRRTPPLVAAVHRPTTIPSTRALFAEARTIEDLTRPGALDGSRSREAG